MQFSYWTHICIEIANFIRLQIELEVTLMIKHASLYIFGVLVVSICMGSLIFVSVPFDSPECYSENYENNIEIFDVIDEFTQFSEHTGETYESEDVSIGIKITNFSEYIGLYHILYPERTVEINYYANYIENLDYDILYEIVRDNYPNSYKDHNGGFIITRHYFTNNTFEELKVILLHDCMIGRIDLQKALITLQI